MKYLLAVSLVLGLAGCGTTPVSPELPPEVKRVLEQPTFTVIEVEAQGPDKQDHVCISIISPAIPAADLQRIRKQVISAESYHKESK
jgi:hypothetical protein